MNRNFKYKNLQVGGGKEKEPRCKFTRYTYKLVGRVRMVGGGGGAFGERAAYLSFFSISFGGVQQCRKRRENFRIIYTHFLKSEKLLTLIIKEKHSNFGANMSELQIFSLKILKLYLRL